MDYLFTLIFTFGFELNIKWKCCFMHIGYLKSIAIKDMVRIIDGSLV